MINILILDTDFWVRYRLYVTFVRIFNIKEYQFLAVPQTNKPDKTKYNNGFHKSPLKCD